MKTTKSLLFIILIVGTFVTFVINKTPQKNSVPKEYISAQQFLDDSFKLAQSIFESGYKPTFLIALWRGGSQVGIAITEYFEYKNMPIENHLAVRVSAYNHDQLKPTAKVFNLDDVVKTLTPDDTLLIVDDVVDTGTSIQALLKEIQTLCGDNTPRQIKIASTYYKPNSAIIIPDFYVRKTNHWLVFPHELHGLSIDEIRQTKGEEISKTL
ncbi:hypoxanthine phosphoribosyltransferase [Candidatus Dependentiae bacterium]|nr:hypoxanthine phosphoribosyltransferase [Candidatus Dependentiae bacterium]